MKPLGFFDRRVRGFRVVEVGAASLLLILVLVVYLAKTGAGDKRADIDRVQQQIDDDQAQIHLLRAEVATLEQPARLEDLSARYLNLQPISANHEVTPEALADVARLNDPALPAKPSAPAKVEAPKAEPAAGAAKPQPATPAPASIDAAIDAASGPR